jgi:NAD(P)-dependent dehydrogenase (short-subunit alcohol dehydrogenase family)
VDHTDESEVADLFKLVKKQSKRLDILVNVLTGSPVTSWDPFWKQSVDAGHAQFEGWIWPHVATCRHAVPLMVARKSGLIVEIVEQTSIGYHGQFYFDMFETALKRLAFALAEELAAHGVTALAISPGFLRTEAILDKFGVTEANWREAAETNAEAKRFGFINSESPCFVGRAVAAIAADPDRARWSGDVTSSWHLSEAYGFTDIDGSRPNIWPVVEAHYVGAAAIPHASHRWELVRSSH